MQKGQEGRLFFGKRKFEKEELNGISKNLIDTENPEIKAEAMEKQEESAYYIDSEEGNIPKVNNEFVYNIKLSEEYLVYLENNNQQQMNNNKS